MQRPASIIRISIGGDQRTQRNSVGWLASLLSSLLLAALKGTESMWSTHGIMTG